MKPPRVAGRFQLRAAAVVILLDKEVDTCQILITADLHRERPTWIEAACLRQLSSVFWEVSSPSSETLST